MQLTVKKGQRKRDRKGDGNIIVYSFDGKYIQVHTGLFE